jgi:hypothetical protein
MSNPFLNKTSSLNKNIGKHNIFSKPSTTATATASIPNTNDQQLFPDLHNQVEATNISTTSTKFKDILNNVVETDIKPVVVKPGWVKISDTIEYGTPVVLPKIVQPTDNDNMYLAIEIMQRKWNAHTALYDEMNGENSYANKFKLPPIYDSETDEEKDDKQQDNNYEYISDFEPS